MNEHWLDKEGKHGMSDYFWRCKYPIMLEITGMKPCKECGYVFPETKKECPRCFALR